MSRSEVGRRNDWADVHRELIAKAIGELTYEEVLSPTSLSEGASNAVGDYRLCLSGGIHYDFRAWRGIWTGLHVQPHSIVRNTATERGHTLSAAQFFIDAQKDLGMSDITLGHFLEEMHNSVHADLALKEKTSNLDAEELSIWDGERLQMVLPGHPKILLNKGRLGWGAQEFALYSPERENPVQMHWLAAKRDLVRLTLASHSDEASIVRESLNETEFARLLDALAQNELDLSSYTLIPMHPWQWQRYIQIQFADFLLNRNLVYLGSFGDLYRPQISLRTFTNISRPGRMDLKLPLTILNTSAFRGISGKTTALGSVISDLLDGLCHQDEFLREAGCGVLRETCGLSFSHRHFDQVREAPYRFQELLGAIWRESASSKLNPGEIAVMTGALSFRDAKGRSLLGSYIRKSGLTTTEWLRDYARHVVLPLYHLQRRYGVGLVAHGQNVILKLKDFRPSGVLLKDFQNDLRFSESSPLLRHADLSDVTRLPSEHLIHDLITGHFVTVLRFMSATLFESEGVAETAFYREIGLVIRDYFAQTDTSTLSPFDLLRPEFERVIVNKVRFQRGYGDSAERLLPLLGTPLKNPFLLGLLSTEEGQYEKA